MYRFYMALIEMLAAAVFIVPALVIENRLCFHSWKRTAFYILFGLYLAAVLALVGFPNLTTLRVDLTVNLIPFLDLAADFKNAWAFSCRCCGGAFAVRSEPSWQGWP